MCDSAMAIQEIYKILIQDGTISDQKKEQLTVLEAYKKSLIYEYVTGKKEVPVQ